MTPHKAARCRGCGAPVTRTFVDLGMMPAANAFLASAAEAASEKVYPLHARVCGSCLLVQLEEVIPREVLFEDYPYFSSCTDSWVEHARRFAEQATARFGLGPGSQVIEVASNDGYLLKHFVAAGIPSLGIEPAANVAEAAIAAGVPTLVRFFGRETAENLVHDGKQADLLVCNNVLAHVPDLHDFVASLRIILSEGGVISLEFPHLLNLIREVQFDTIYHEHYSYLSLIAIERLFGKHGLRIFDVERLSTHGGSLRVFVCASEAGDHRAGPGLAEVRLAEAEAGLDRLEPYEGFAEKVEGSRRDFLDFLAKAKNAGKKIVGYGAAAKGNTFLNHARVTPADIAYVVDISPHKQNHLLPGSHVPVYPPERIAETKPDYLLILPWNLRDEIMSQMAFIREWGGQFVTAVPELRVWP